MSSAKQLSFSVSMAMVFASISAPAVPRPGKAVYEFSVETGMKLTEKALKNIEVKTAKISASGESFVPGEALVYFQDQVGVYRFREGWFKLVSVQVVKKASDQALIRSGELSVGDEIAVHGADLLRVSEMHASGGEE